MTGMPNLLNDDSARGDAISRHGSSILVEAGAGSGKTAVMAGRIALMLAEGTAPRSIAAVTFTELAASELLSRVREFVAELNEGRIARELKVALPGGLSEAQRRNLANASAAIDEITCSTIHGFCQRLIKPYPAEADIDPGAAVMDRGLADLAFREIVDGWLRERLSGENSGMLAEMVLYNPKSTVELIHKIAGKVRDTRTIKAASPAPLVPRIDQFMQASSDFTKFCKTAGAHEPETIVCAEGFAQMAQEIAAIFDPHLPANLVQLLGAQPHSDVCTKAGDFATFRKKGKWVEAAKQAGLSKADGEQLNIAADGNYAECCAGWSVMRQSVASHVLAAIVAEATPILTRFRDYKRSSAQLDFDDLIYAARDLLRHHEDVRQALGKRFRHVLVDEFQDTDPLQTEIFWRLCGEPQTQDDDWTNFKIRPGALFLVGDPKQAIYRFRGADVGAYVQARGAFAAQNDESLLSISTNFRSCASILTFVNERFQAVLSADGQPGFTALDAFHVDPEDGVCVAALDVAVAGENGKASVDRQRDGEADAVAELCARLIGQQIIVDRDAGQLRLCQPGDIALLAPTGAELWRYEEALESRGIPVATQAGKGLFRRQEVQDLIALTRILADRRDTLALGALLRGPLVGLTEEELLDIVWSLPRGEEEPDRLPRLTLSVDAETVQHDLARSVILKLQALARRTNSTTPHELLSQAIDVLRVRPLLVERHHGQAERALANLDLYLSLSTAYAVRGLRAFSEAMTAAWKDQASAVEGRPDAQEEAISLITMHAAKGLEWPIVIPINTMTGVMGPDNAVTDRETDILYCSIFGVRPEGHEAALAAERLELDRERIRLWYVATTRARQLLVLPRLDVSPSPSAWISVLDLSLSTLPGLPTDALPASSAALAANAENKQTREMFAAEAEQIARRQVHLTWLAPSRNENASGPVFSKEEAGLWTDTDDDQPHEPAPEVAIQGGRERGLILHKLMEEVLTGETAEEMDALAERANELIAQLGWTSIDDAAAGLSAGELASCVLKTLKLGPVAALRSELLAEFPVYSNRAEDGHEIATFGIADALTRAPDGTPDVIVDWKSDVAPDANTLKHYRSQVRAYLDMTGAKLGLIVLMTSGQTLEVVPSIKEEVSLVEGA
jgi:ATP-dependent exoDNAse (exonuclease V) beta subunit